MSTEVIIKGDLICPSSDQTQSDVQLALNLSDVF